MQSQPWFWQLTVIIIVDLAISLYQDTILWGVAHWRSKIRCKCRAEKKAKSFFEDIVNISQKKDSISISLFVFKNEKQMYTSFKKFQIVTTKICMNHYILFTVKKKFGNISLDRHFSKTTKHTSWVLFAIRRYP